ncbi:MAG: DUF6119 family protein [Candidatus Izemoplasmatales bacterium]
MRKEKYTINVYKLEKYYSSEELLGLFKKKMDEANNRVSAVNGSLSDGDFDIVFFAYKIQYIDDSDITWYDKWKEFFQLQEALRSSSMTGHGVICVQNRKKGYSFVLVFGRAFVLVRDLIEYDYGISMADKLFDGKSADAISSKYFSMVKNKSIFDYYEGSSMFIEDGQAVDIIKSRITEDPNRNTDRYISTLLDNVAPIITVFYSYLHLSISKTEINLLDVVTVLDCLFNIEYCYQPRFPIPRMKPVPKQKSAEIDTILINLLKLDTESEELVVSVPFYFRNEADGYSFLVGIESLQLSYHGEHEKYETLEHEDIKAFIKNKNVMDVREVILTAKSETSDHRQCIMNWIDTQLKVMDDTYVLFEGRWCTFNDAYIDRVNQKVKQLEQNHIRHIPEFSVSDGELWNYLEAYPEEIQETYTGGKSFGKPYLEFIYNYILSKKPGWTLFDRVMYKSIEICDLSVLNTTHIHVKFGNASKLEEALRQSIAGLRIFEREKQAIRSEVRNKEGKTLSDSKTIVVLYLSDLIKKKGEPSNSNSLKLKQTFIDWAEEVKNSQKEYLLVIAKSSETQGN